MTDQEDEEAPERVAAVKDYDGTLCHGKKGEDTAPVGRKFKEGTNSIAVGLDDLVGVGVGLGAEVGDQAGGFETVSILTVLCTAPCCT